MRQINYRIVIALLTVFLWSNLSAQQTDIPRMISYQGNITQEGKALSGEYPVTVTLYADALGKEVVWLGTYKTKVTDGIFNVMLGSGQSQLPAPAKIDRPMWVGVAIDGEVEMKP